MDISKIANEILDLLDEWALTDILKKRPEDMEEFNEKLRDILEGA